MNKTIITIIIIAVVLVGGYFLLGGTYQPKPSVTQPSSKATQSSALEPSNDVAIPQPPVSQTSTTEEKVVTYTDLGYSPSTLTVKNGETVIFKNQSSQSMWTASAVHPSHIVYSGTSLGTHCPDIKNTTFDTCAGTKPGSAWSFTFTKQGTWKYHNHLSPGDTGTIIVE